MQIKVPSFLSELVAQLRVDAVRAGAAADLGHPTSSRSVANLVAVLRAPLSEHRPGAGSATQSPREEGIPASGRQDHPRSFLELRRG
jgi:hypothetical protein